MHRDELETAYQAWNKEFQKEYREKDAQWSEAYLSFAERERAWVNDLASKAAKVGSDEILAEAGMSAEVMSRDSTIISGMVAASLHNLGEIAFLSLVKIGGFVL